MTNKTFKTILLIAAVSVCGGQARANGPVLTLEAALALAETRHISLRMARENIQAAEGQITEARSGALPHLNLNAQYTRLDDVPVLGTGETAMELGQLDNNQVTADAEQTLYAGGAVRAALRMAGEHRAAMHHRMEYTRSEVAYSIHLLFNRVLLARQDVRVSEEATDRARKNLDDVTARHQQGLAAPFDVMRAREQFSRSRSDAIAASNGLQKARLALMRALELPLNDPREITGELVPEQFSPDRSKAIQTALANRQDIAEAARNAERQKEAVRIARSGLFPRIGLFGQAKYSNPDRSYEAEWESSWMAGIRGEIPVFDGKLTRGKVAQQKARLRQAEIEAESLAAQAALEVSNALADLETSDELLKARRNQMEEAEEALRLARLGYREGLQQQIDVLNAQLAMSDSQRAYARAVFEQVMARRRLEHATGTLTKNSEIGN